MLIIKIKEKLGKYRTLVMDNLNTHNAGSLYEKFPPDKAKALCIRQFEFDPSRQSDFDPPLSG